MNNTIKIKTSYWGLSFTILTALVLVSMFVRSIFFSDHSSSLGSIPLVVASVLILMFVLYAIFGIYQLIHSKPALIIDEEGITNHYAGFDTLHLHWSEIESIKISSLGLRTNLIIKSKAGAKKIGHLPFISRIYFFLNQVNFFSQYILRLDHYDFHEIGKSKDFHALLESYRDAAKH